MADVALVSVIATGTVGTLGAVSAGVVGYYAQHASVKIDQAVRRERRRTGVRRILQDAAKVAIAAHSAADATPGTFDSLSASTSELYGQVRASLAEISVHLGPASRVSRTYEEFADALRGLHQKVVAAPTDEVVNHLPERRPDEIRQLDTKLKSFLTEAFNVPGERRERSGSAGVVLRASR